jgi:hypothetical protein
MADAKDDTAHASAVTASAAETRAATEDAADAERRLARYAAMGIPLAALVGAIGAGMLVGLGPAILILAAGTLLGTIALLWASLRTLSGDAPLPTDLENIAIRSRKVDSLGERKRRVLRALKDLELEHSVGKIDEKDFASLDERFRGEAKALMREMDGQLDPFRDEAERLAKRHLDKRGLKSPAVVAKPSRDDEDDLDDADETDHADETDEVVEAAPPPPPKSKPKRAAKAAGDTRLACPKCETSNEADATFCKKCGASLTAPETHA